MNNNLNALPHFASNAAKFKAEEKRVKRKREFALIFFGVLIGFVNGLFGAGGGMLVVPVLTGVACLSEKQSHATAIAVILPLCAVSAAVYFFKGSYDYSPFAPSICGVLIGSILGALALKKVSNVALKFFFYGLMLFAGLKMLV